MTAIALLGKDLANRITENLAKEIHEFTEATGIIPGLVVVLVGDDPASQTYVRNKERACLKAGLKAETVRMPEQTTTEELIAVVRQLNKRVDVHAVLVQMPLPRRCDIAAVVAAIDPRKDVDCFHPENIGLLTKGTPAVAPCTPAGIMEILSDAQIPLLGKHVVVVGRSDIVGKPVAFLALREHATVTICHSRTEDIAAYTRQADILIAAVGKPWLIRGDMIKAGAAVIDVGINHVTVDQIDAIGISSTFAEYETLKRKGYLLVGDVCTPEAMEVAAAVTPVPGGVGPMTIAMLMKSTLLLARKQYEESKENKSEY